MRPEPHPFVLKYDPPKTEGKPLSGDAAVRHYADCALRDLVEFPGSNVELADKLSEIAAFLRRGGFRVV